MALGMIGPTFGELQARLLEHVRLRIRNGELTERNLARTIGMSQPHVHNVLKGARALTPGMADLILSGLGLSAIDMAKAAELGDCLQRHKRTDSLTTDIPVLRGLLGPGRPFPDTTDAAEWVRVPGQGLAGVSRPVLAGLDDEQGSLWHGATMALLDLDEGRRACPERLSWYAVRWGGAGFIRQVEYRSGTLRILGQTAFAGPPGPETIAVDRVGVLSVIRARVVWVGPDVRRVEFLRQVGFFLDIPAST